MNKLRVAALFCFLATCLTFPASTQQEKPRTILLSVHAEKEGPNGLWVQSGQDLTDAELARFQKLLESAIGAMKDVQLVRVEDQRDHVEIVVSLVKVPRGNGKWWYAASSAVGLAELKKDVFVSHNVIVCEDVEGVAKAIRFSFASIRLREAFGLTSK